TRWQLPRSIVKVAMMTSAAFAVYLSRGSLIGLDAGVALLITAFTLKLVELRSRRDALVLIFLGFFAIVTSYLYDDSLLAALYSLLPAVALLAAWTGLQQGQTLEPMRRNLVFSLRLLAQAIPFALLLFAFFPRLEPLWTLPQPGGKGKTGLSGQMSPGDIAELSQSTELAFRATFEGEIPPKSQLYWRALTLPVFDGRSWRLQDFGMEIRPGQWHMQGDSLPYSVIMQPSHRPWLFSLDYSAPVQDDVQLLADFRLQRNRPVHRSYLYEATAWPQSVADPVLPAARKRQYLQLPRPGNPRTREWARQLREQYEDDRQLVQALLSHFNLQPYYYTLKPPLLGENSIDEFMFDTRRGFCEHYSSAMTFSLRVAGIPARVVTGYQGGEINPAGNFVQVRQMDAHAWVEYWLPGQGWQRADPTFQVAPGRIEQGLQDALLDEADLLDTGLFSPMRYRHVAWINQLRMGWENLNHGWQTRVLGYQGERQQAWLRQLFGQVNWQQIGVGLVVALLVMLGVLALWLIRPWRNRPDPVSLQLQKLDRLLARQGLARKQGEGLNAFCLRCRASARLNSVQQAALEQFAARYEACCFAGQPVPVEHLRQARRQLAATFRPWHSG
ncbi:MAG: DUF3488 and DUF4129 domain-containing transglutaminase family protein, partial [Thiopseudomonas sp.]